MNNRPRVIPCLLLKNGGLVKTIQFTNPRYIGDPINAVKIFNEKCVDELILLDIMCSKEQKEPNFQLISDIASEAFMPMGYGGGITSISHISTILGMGYEKVIINTSAVLNPELIVEASKVYGSQSIVVSIDTKPDLFGRYKTYIKSGSQEIGMDPVELARMVVDKGAGEILINCIHKDGIMNGYDLRIINKISRTVEVPVIACGGAGSVTDLYEALHQGDADAVAAGSMFVYYGKHRAVLITFPEEEDLIKEGVYIE